MMEESRGKKRATKKFPIFLVFGLILFFIFSYFFSRNFARAASAPSIITYQGKLLVGSYLATTTQSMTFVLYNSLTGGTALYSASGTIASPLSISVTPSQGLFSVNLGDTGTNGISSTIFRDNASVFLEVRVGSDTLTPRKRITSVPYAFNAAYLDGVGSATVSSSTYIPVSDASGNFTFNSTTITTSTISRLTVSNTLGIGTTSNASTLIVQGVAGSNPILDIASSTGSSLVRVLANGNVGIGTTTPSEKLQVVGNISNITKASTTISQIATVSVGTTPYSVFISGRYAYVANFNSDNISIVDISNPSAPTQIATTSVGDGPYSIYVSGRYAYVANANGGSISVVDISNPSAPTQIATTSVGANPRSIYVSGRYAYTANTVSDNISVVDISNPSAPTQIATTSVGTNPQSIYVSGRYAYTANVASDSISIVDISNPSAPTQIATTSVGDAPYSIYVSGRYAYVANANESSVSVVSISNPSAPTQITTTSVGVGTLPTSIYVSGRYAYVANNGSANISIVDISSSTSPSQISTVSVGSGPRSIHVSGRYAYVANANDSNISVVDISGTEVTSLIAHSAEVGNIQSRNDIFAQGNIMAGTSLMVGAGGIMSNGSLSVYASSTGATSSIFSIDSAQTSNILKVFANGNIGIGTSTPIARLTIQGAGTENPFSILTSTAAAGSMFTVLTNGRVGINSSSPVASFALQGTAGTNLFEIASSTGASLLRILTNGNVGIGTSTPIAALTINDGAILAVSSTNPAGTPMSGGGTRFMWIPSKAALRAGIIDGAQWDDVNIGSYSSAFGYNTVASGAMSFAFGNGAVAEGTGSFAGGLNVTSSLNRSFAYGETITSTGPYAIAFGKSITVNGTSSVAIGDIVIASGTNAFAIGREVQAIANNSFALGYSIRANGQYSFGIGLDATPRTASQANTLSIMGGIVGIGTTTPASKLVVTASTTDNTASALNITNSNNSSLFFIRNDGNIGISSSSPSIKLSLVGTAGNNDVLDVASSTGTSLLRVTAGGSVGINSSSPIASLAVQGVGGINPFSVNSSTGDSLLSVLTNGKVGINSSSPNAVFAVQGIAGVDGIFSVASSTGAVKLRVGNSGAVLFGGIADTTDTGLRGTGNIFASGQVRADTAGAALYAPNGIAWINAGTVSAVGYGFNGDGNNGMYAPAADTLALVTDGVERIRISPTTGNVGIGTTTPSEKLQVVGNISNVISPNTTISELATSPVGDGPFSVFVSGKYAYVSNLIANNISVVDISRPTAPRQISTTTVGTAPRGIFVSGRYAYVANYNVNSISVVDISNPARPIQVATTSAGTNPISVYVSGKYAYVANYGSSNISVIDVSNPTAPTQIATVGVGSSPQSVYISGRYAYTANVGTDNMSIVDISNPSNPVSIATVAVGDEPYSVYVSGQYAYTANNASNTISIVDISNPTAPALLSTSSVGSGPYSIYVSGRYAYVANNVGNTISIVDVSNTSSPAQVATTSLGTNPSSVYVSGRYAYVTNYGSDTVSVVDISGTEVTSLIAHSADVGNIQSRNDIFAQGNIMAGTSLLVGSGGIMSNGSLSVYASSTGVTSSIFGIDSAQRSNIFKVFANGNVGIGTSTPTAKLSIVGTAGSNDVLDVASSTGESLLRVTAGGYLGIGTTTPGAPVHAVFTGTSPAIFEKYATSTIGPHIHFRKANGTPTTPSVSLDGDGTGGMTMNGYGATAFKNSARVRGIINDLNGDGISNTSMPGALLFETVAGGSVTLSERMRITSQGNVGIGTTTPLARLFVQGAGTFNPFSIVSSTAAASSMFTVLTNGNIGVNSSTPMNTFSVQGKVSMLGLDVNITGNGVCVTATGTITDAGAAACVPSALQFKTNVTPYTDSAVQLFNKLVDAGAVTNYERKDKPGLRRGLIADYVANIDEDLVVYNNGQIWSLNFEDFTGLAVAAIAELDDKISKRQEVLTIDATSSIIMVGSSTNPYNLIVTGNVSLSGTGAANKLSFATSTLLESNLSPFANAKAFTFNAAGFTLPNADNYILSVRANNNSVFSVAANGDVRAAGNYFGASMVLGTSTNPGDLAERVDIALDDNAEAGDVMVVDKNTPDTYRRSAAAYEQSVAGVISTNPTIVVGNGKTDYTAVLAMVGRVPVKVSNENGNIQRGDLLITASVAGYAMKYDPSKDGGSKMVAVIGVALESFDSSTCSVIPNECEGSLSVGKLDRDSSSPTGSLGMTFVGKKILALIRTGWIYNRDQAITKAQDGISQLAAVQGISLDPNNSPSNFQSSIFNSQSISNDLNLNYHSIINVATIQGKDNKWRIDEWGNIIQKIATAKGEKEVYGLQSTGRQEVVISGTSTLENGYKKVLLTELDQEIIDKSIPLKVSITMSGETKGVYVLEKGYDSFTVKENESGQSNATFDWIVIAKILSSDTVVESAPAVENIETETVVTEIPAVIPKATQTTTVATVEPATTTTETVDIDVSSVDDTSSGTLATP